MAWDHQFIDPTGRVKPCCRFAEKFRPDENNLNQKTLSEVFYGDWMNDVRDKMMQGEEVPGCIRCYQEEAAGHIAGHIQQRRGSAGLGGLILGGLIAYSGGSAQNVDSAFDLGAAVGSRVYSKDHELQADEIGTLITYYAGYDPVRGSKFFTRIPDPGDKFLGSHPPNAARIDRVNRTMARLR